MNTSYIFKYTNYLKAIFVVFLRTAFKAESIPERYRYNRDENQSRIQIYRSFPRRTFRPPTIVVSAEAGNASVSSLGYEELKSIKDDLGNIIGYQIYGKLEIPVKITIYSLNTSDREILTDLVALCLRYLFRQKLLDRGISYTKIRIGGEAEETWRNQILYTNTITIDCYSEFTIDLGVDIVDIINNINVEAEIKLLEKEGA